MNIIRRAIVGLVVVTAPTSVACDAAEPTVYIVSIQHVGNAPDERIGQLRIDITCGQIESVLHIPRDWYILINNKANCETSVQGNTIHGAGALGEAELREFKIRIIKNETYGTFGLAGQVSVTKDFETERFIDLKPSDFRLEE